MSGIIDNIITLYDMRAKTLGVLMANTQKALDELEEERKADEQAKEFESFVKELSKDLNNMLTKFYFQKEHQRMADGQVKALTDFVSFTQSLTEKVRELLTRSQKGETFEKTNERQLQQLQARVEQKLKEFDDALNGTSDTLKKRLIERVGNVVNGVTKSFRREGFDAADAKRAGKSAAWGLTKVEQT
jgi:uncharacterized phage infection (PIP) family protein YhgE